MHIPRGASSARRRVARSVCVRVDIPDGAVWRMWKPVETRRVAGTTNIVRRHGGELDVVCLASPLQLLPGYFHVFAGQRYVTEELVCTDSQRRTSYTTHHCAVLPPDHKLSGCHNWAKCKTLFHAPGFLGRRGTMAAKRHLDRFSRFLHSTTGS